MAPKILYIHIWISEVSLYLHKKSKSVKQDSILSVRPVDNSFYVFSIKFLDVNLICGATDMVTSALGFKARVDTLACMPRCPCPMNSSDSNLVQHLVTFWQSAWQPSYFDPHTCTHTSINVTRQPLYRMSYTNIYSMQMIFAQAYNNKSIDHEHLKMCRN